MVLWGLDTNQTGSDQKYCTSTDQLDRPAQSGPDQIYWNGPHIMYQTRFVRTKPDQHQTRPDQTRPRPDQHHTRPRPDQTKTRPGPVLFRRRNNSGVIDATNARTWFRRRPRPSPTSLTVPTRVPTCATCPAGFHVSHGFPRVATADARAPTQSVPPCRAVSGPSSAQVPPDKCWARND